MKFMNRLVVPALALAALTAACEDGNDPTVITTTTTANVRFINAVNGSGSLALTSNGSMVGPAQSFWNGSGALTCSTVNTSTSGNAFAFGTANTGGTGINGTAFSTFNKNLTSNGNYTIIATGSSTAPSYIFLDNTATTAASTGFSNVRFVNATGNSNLNVSGYATTTSNLTGATAVTTGLNSTNTFSTYMSVPTTNGTFTLRDANGTTLSSSTYGLLSGGNYTVVLVPGATAGTYQTLVYSGTC